MTSSQTKFEVPFQRVLIIGLGVMGGSFAKSLQQEEIELFGLDVDATVCQQASKELDITCITYDDIQTIESLDLVIVTAMPQQVIPTLEILNEYLTEQTLVMEISGIKTKLVDELKEKRWNFPLILTHPMAGRESGGYTFSREGLFTEVNILFIDDGSTATMEQVNQVEAFFAQLGTTKIFTMDAAQHDAHITFTSQLSHVLASSLLLSEDYDEKTKHTIGDSFRDLTRIANMNVPMWEALFLENKEQLVPSIDALIQSLEKMKQAIQQEDMNELSNQLYEAKKRRQEF